MTKYIVLLGPPGAGKGTQAQIIAEKYDLVHVSSGDLFRENLKQETELGKLAQSYMKRGELVPDDVTIAMVRDRLSQPDCSQWRTAGWISANACPGGSTGKNA